MTESEEPDVEQSSTLILGSEVPFRESLIRGPSRVLELESDGEESQVSARKPTLDVTPEGIATWRSQIARASAAERELFLKYRAGDLQKYTSAIEKTVSDHGENSLGLKVARGLNPIFKTMNLYAPIAQTMIQTDPTSSSLILGGITCIMAISARYEDYQKKISAMLSGMLEKLDILMKYGENIYKNNAQMQEAIMKVFGDIYLKLVKRARKAFKDVEKNGLIDLEEISTKFEEEIVELYREYKPDREVPDFSCSGYHYIEVRDQSSMENSDKEYFGADGKLKAEWLSSLLYIYQDVAIEPEAKGIVKHSLSRSDSYLESENVQEGGSTLGDEIVLLTHVLTDEPVEMADSNGVTNQEVSEEHKPNPVSSSLQCSNDVDTKKTNHVSQYNRQLLLRVRGDLEKQVRLAVANVGAAEEAELKDVSRDDMRLPVSKETLNGGIKSANNSSAARTDDQTRDNPEQISLHSKEKNHTEKSRSNGNDDDASKDKTEPGKQLEEFTRAQNLLFLELMECEMSFTFAQLILSGAVTESLLVSILGDERNNSQEVDQSQTAIGSKNSMLDGISTDSETRPLDETKEKHNVIREELVLVGQNVQSSKNDQEIEVESHACVGEISDEGKAKADGEGGDLLTKLHGGGKATEKVVSNLRQTSIDDTVISQDRYKAIRQASIDILPPSPLSRRTTDLLEN